MPAHPLPMLGGAVASRGDAPPGGGACAFLRFSTSFWFLYQKEVTEKQRNTFLGFFFCFFLYVSPTTRRSWGSAWGITLAILDLSVKDPPAPLSSGKPGRDYSVA